MASPRTSAFLSGGCAAAALVVAAAVAPPAHAQSSPGDWFVPGRPVATSFSALAAGERAVYALPAPVVLDAESPRATVRVTVPPGTAVGPEVPWIVRLKVSAEVLERPKAARRVTLSTLLNGKSASQVTVAARSAGGASETSVTQVGLLGGNQRSVTSGTTVGSVHENYAQRDAVRVGVNDLTFDLATGPDRLRTKVTVLAAELVATPNDHREYAVAVPEKPVRVVAGGAATFDIEIRRRGMRPDHSIRVEQAHDTGVVAVSPALVERTAIGERVRLTYRVEGVAPGETTVLFRLDSAYNHPASEVRIEVVPEDGDGWERGSYAMAGAGLLLAGLGFGLRRGRHA